MSTDLERRLHDELRDRARDAGAWNTGGATLRRAADDAAPGGCGSVPRQQRLPRWSS